MKTHRYTSAENHLQVTETTQRIATRKTRTRWKQLEFRTSAMQCAFVHRKQQRGAGERLRAGYPLEASNCAQNQCTAPAEPHDGRNSARCSKRARTMQQEGAHDAARGRARCSRMSSRSGLGHNCMDKSLVCALQISNVRASNL